MRLLLSLLTGLVLGPALMAQSLCYVSGSITDSNIWSCDTVLLNDDIIVEEGGLLIIQASVRVLFNGGKRIIVKGAIQAEGSASDPVIFDGRSLTGNAAGGGIRLEPTNSAQDSSLFTHCIFEYCGSDSARQIDSAGALLVIRPSALKFAFCHFYRNKALRDGGAIHLKYTSAKISNSSFLKNESASNGGAVYIESGLAVEIDQCSFIRNRAEVEGGGIFCVDNEASFTNNIFYTNRSIDSIGPGTTIHYGGAMYLRNHQGGMYVAGNTVYNNISNGAIYESTAQSQIVNNLIFNNAGFGIWCANQASEAIYVNNTICHNQAGGIFASSQFIKIYNSIISLNASPLSISQIFPYDSLPFASHCCITGNYQGPGLFNLDADPNFIQATLFAGSADSIGDFNWRIPTHSACVNQGLNIIPDFTIPGSDIEGNPRVNNNRIDIGAYEYQSPAAITGLTASTGCNIFPNPASEEIQILSVSSGECQLILYDLLGKELYHQFFTGKTMVRVSHFPPGQYILRITQEGGKISSQKLIKY